MMRFVLLFTVALAACNAPDSAPTEPDATTDEDTVIAPQDAAFSRALLLDEQLPYGQSRSVTLPAEPGQEPRVLRRWERDGRTAKITATEPDDAGRMTGQSVYFFEDGELFLARHPFAQYVFEDGQLVAWVNEDRTPIEVNETDRAAREAAVLDEVARYEAAFDE